MGSFRLLARRSKAWPLWLMAAAVMASMAGCTAESAPGPRGESPPGFSAPISSAPAGEAIAVIGGKSISRSEFMDRLIAGFGSEVLREMLLREAVGMESARLGITVTDEELDRELRRMSEGYESEQEFYRSMKEHLGMDRGAVREDAKYRLLLEKLATKDVRIPDADIRQYYEDHKQEYGPRKQMELAWILTETREEAEQVLALLESGADFRALAAQYSIDELTSADGGNLGWIEEGDPFYDPGLLEAASRLQVGEAAGPIPVEHGFAMVELLGIKTIQGKPFDSVREEIRMMLALEQAIPMRELERSLLSKYEAQTLDPRLKLE